MAASSSHKCVPGKEEHFAIDSDWWASARVAVDDWPSIGTSTGLGFRVENVAVFAHRNAFTGSVSGMIDFVNFIVLARERTVCDVRTIGTHAVSVISSVILIYSAANDLVFNEKGVLPLITCGTIASCSWKVSIFANARVLLVVVNEPVSAADEIVFLIVKSIFAFKTVCWPAAKFVNRD